MPIFERIVSYVVEPHEKDLILYKRKGDEMNAVGIYRICNNIHSFVCCRNENAILAVTVYLTSKGIKIDYTTKQGSVPLL